MSERTIFDVAIVGGGIAGMSLAGELCRNPGVRVAVLEQEAQLAYHSSGRSAATFLESYGSHEIRALTRASRPLFRHDDGEPPLLVPRPLLWLAAREHIEELAHLLSVEPVLRAVDEDEARRMCPAIRPGWSTLAAVEDGAQDLDVAAVFDRYRRLAVRGGATILTGARLQATERVAHGWLLHTGSGDVRAATVVDAAGGWADQVAAMCGVAPVGLTPLRRTVAVAVSDAVDRWWPLVCDIADGFYFRPEGDALLVSPADETPTEAGDIRPTTEDVALALHNINEATTLDLRHVRTSWAGLRTFAPDREPVVGYDAAYPDFFWLAGQGGYGMQTAPALARFAASLIRGERLPRALADEGFDSDRLAPARFG